MLADARELVGDLTVTSVELAERRVDLDRWLRLASATAAALRSQAAPPELATLADALDPRALRAARVAAEEICEHGTDWERACMARSGIEAIRDLFELRFFDELDPSRLERAMIQRGSELYRPCAVPEDAAPWHWWWRAPAPPNERTLRMNNRMRALLPESGPGHFPPASDVVAPLFRQLVARGFVASDNTVRLADVLLADPSRRPVDLAAAGLACVRHLAYELERRRSPRCRIELWVHPARSTIGFRQIRDNEVSADSRNGAMLALDT